MRNTPLFLAVSLFLAAPLVVVAYSQSDYYGEGGYYGESTYYSQSTYYAQSAYTPNITFTTPLTIQGNLSITGTIGKGSGTFVIDHPLDPLNKLLYHSFVESPDAKNMYDGIANLDAEGEATVTLPSYFGALSKDIRYQIKPIGKAMPDLHIKREVEDNRFVIGGGLARGRVSWQVTAVRNDPFIRANPIVTEVQKGRDALVEKYEYLFPEYYENNSLFGRIGVLFVGFLGADQ